MSDPTMGTSPLLTISDLMRAPRIIESRWVPLDTAYLFSQGLPLPVGWDEMSQSERLTYAVENGWLVLIKNIAMGDTP